MTAPIRSDSSETLSEHYFRLLLSITDDPGDRARIKQQAAKAGYSLRPRRARKVRRYGAEKK
jgi:hypothetical protein